MNSKSILLILSIGCLTGIRSADTVNCYQCMSAIGYGCKDKFDPSGTGVTQHVCNGACLKAYINEHGQGR